MKTIWCATLYERIGRVAVVLVCIGATMTALAGDLDPPAGPIAPTMKTLQEVEPRIAINASNTPGDAEALYVISAPGAYSLAANVAGVAGKHGIKIDSEGVTLEGNGVCVARCAGFTQRNQGGIKRSIYALPFVGRETPNRGMGQSRHRVHGKRMGCHAARRGAER